MGHGKPPHGLNIAPLWPKLRGDREEAHAHPAQPRTSQKRAKKKLPVWIEHTTKRTLYEVKRWGVSAGLMFGLWQVLIYYLRNRPLCH
jgi:hypothetical protein